MMVMTAKVDIRKIILILAAVAGIILALILLLRGGSEEPSAATIAPVSVSDNNGRVKFLTDLGWEVSSSPKESGQVRIPQEASEVFDRYNALQKSAGYDLTPFAGKTVMRYVYKVNNYPGATEPVYATILVNKDTIIGGDITDTSPKGIMQGLVAAKNPQSPTTAAEDAAAAEGMEIEPITPEG